MGLGDDDDGALVENTPLPDPRARYDAEPPVRKILGQGGAASEGLDATLQQFVQPLYVGDRVRVRNNNHLAQQGRNQRRGSLDAGSKGGAQGQVMYVGPCGFGGGRAMVGLRMDDRPLGGGHDGKEKGERHFRCEPGLGTYVLQADVELVSRGGVLRAMQEAEDDDAPPFELERALERVVGIDAVKSSLLSLRNRLEVGRRRAAFGVQDNKPLHVSMVGSKGMDFRGVADVMAGLLKSLGVTKRDHLFEAGRKDLVGANSEKTAELVATTLKKASGGVLLVNDLGALTEKTDHYGCLALQMVVRHFEEQADKAAEAASAAAKERARAVARGQKPKAPTEDESGDRTVLMVSMQRDKLGQIHAAAPGLPTLCGSQLELMDYTPEEITALLRLAAEERGFTLHPELTAAKLTELLKSALAKASADRGGKILVERLVEDAINKQTDRVHLSQTRSKDSLLSLTEADFTEEDTGASGESIDIVLAKLDHVIGLAGVKKHIKSLVAQLQLAQKKKLAGVAGGKVKATMHMVFSGNPGTGKTTIARLVAELLQALGYLKRGHLVETDRAGLVAPYVGQTAIKTQAVVDEAIGGMLFVDEAYALVKDEKDSFGKEALDTLIKLVEDKRDELVVVLAGYPTEMDELMAHNPGVRSRFPTVILFEDYNVSELTAIAKGFLKKQHLNMTEEAEATLEKKLTAMVTAEDVQNGNGRAVRNMMEAAMRGQALRLADDGATLRPSELSLLTAADFI